MINAVVSMLVSAIARVQLCYPSTNWGSTSGTTILQTSASRTMTVPKGNIGKLRLTLTRSDEGTSTMSYRIGASGTFTFLGDIVGDFVEITIVNGDILTFRCSEPSSGLFSTSVVSVEDIMYPLSATNSIGDWACTRN